MSQVFTIAGSFLVMVVLFVTAIFVDKPVSTVLIITALALFVLFFVLSYKLGKRIEDQEASAVDTAKQAHPASTKKSSIFSLIEPPTDPVMNRRYAEGSTWYISSKDGEKVVKAYIMLDGKWTETAIEYRTIPYQDTASSNTMQYIPNDGYLDTSKSHGPSSEDKKD